MLNHLYLIGSAQFPPYGDMRQSLLTPPPKAICLSFLKSTHFPASICAKATGCGTLKEQLDTIESGLRKTFSTLHKSAGTQVARVHILILSNTTRFHCEQKVFIYGITYRRRVTPFTQSHE